ncbi:hypothetical protein [Streptomyces hokutonensis]|uniref:Transposase n=1 Tax=Streptomyces hokutonensis TaxID=1306990 RepID=A0ABW6M635_9ACTN
MSELVVQKIVRPERALSGAWVEVIASNLDYHRATFLWKCEVSRTRNYGYAPWASRR